MTDDGDLDDDLDNDLESGEILDEDQPTHPRFRERLAEVADQSLRTRNRKLLGLGAVVLALLLAAASTQSALFDIEEVRIVGAERSSPDDLREIAAVEIGRPILGFDTEEIEERLRVLPQVADVAVSTNWSGVVTIELDERIPVARIASPEGAIIVAADGTVVDLIAGDVPDVLEVDGEAPVLLDPDGELIDLGAPDLPDDLEQLPEIAGAMFSTEPGKKVPDVLTEALIVADTLPPDIRRVTERIEITVDSLELRVVGGGVISLGDARDLDDKFDAVRAFLAEVDLSCLNTLNVRAPTVPVIERNTGC